MREHITRIRIARRAAAAVALAANLVFPLGGALATGACPAPPTPVRDLSVDRYYADKAGTEVDPARKMAHAESTRPLAAFLRTVTDTADRAVERGDTAAAGCAAAWLETWAHGGALLGTMSGPQAQSQRKWDLAGLALAYLKIKPMLSTEPRATIEPWLTRLADAVHAHAVASGIKRNNHWYWIGVGAGAVALATDNAKHWDNARTIMRDAARDIGPDGTLALELARGPRALHYHAFSVTALVALAELGAARGEDWSAMNHGTLHRLVRVTAEGLTDPSRFDRLAGIAQERPVNPGSGWLDLYLNRHGRNLPEGLPAVPSKHRWLGGDVRLLTKALRGMARAPE